MQDQMVVLQVYLVSMYTPFLLYSHTDDKSKHMLKTIDFMQIATFLCFFFLGLVTNPNVDEILFSYAALGYLILYIPGKLLRECFTSSY